MCTETHLFWGKHGREELIKVTRLKLEDASQRAVPEVSALSKTQGGGPGKRFQEVICGCWSLKVERRGPKQRGFTPPPDALGDIWRHCGMQQVEARMSPHPAILPQPLPQQRTWQLQSVISAESLSLRYSSGTVFYVMRDLGELCTSPEKWQSHLMRLNTQPD